jgi:RNA polymerase sigma factor (sigma-70 family)
MVDLPHCERLVAAAVRGDSTACRQLVEHLWPFWLNRVRTRRSMRVLSKSDDHVHNVVARLVQKLLDPRVLESFAGWQTTGSGANFSQWLHTVTDNEVRDYVRSVAGRSTRTSDSDYEPSAKLLLNEFASSFLVDDLGFRPPNTELQTAQQLLQFATARLAPDQLHVLTRWLKGSTDEETALELGLPEATIRGLRRAAVARLRRAFSLSAQE